MKILKLRQRNYFKKLLSSYILFLLVCFIGLISSYQSVKYQVKSEIETSHQQYLNNRQTIIDSYIEDLHDLSYLTSCRSELNSLYNKNIHDFNSKDYYVMYGITKHLKDIVVTNNIIERISIYLSKSDIFITNSGNYLSHQNVLTQELFSCGEVAFKEKYINKYVSQFIKIDKGHGKNKLIYAQSLPFNPSQVQGIIYIEINKDLLFDLNNMSDNTLWSIVENGEVIFSSGNKELLNYKGNKENLINFTVESKASKYVYAETIRSSDYMGTLKRYELIMGITFIALISIGVIMAYLLSKRNYTPIEDILNVITSDETFKTRDEVSYIKESLVKYRKDFSRIKSSYYHQEEKLREMLLVQCIKSKITDIKQINSILHSSIELKNIQNYMVIIIHCMPGNRPIETLESKEQELNLFIVKNIMKEIIENDFREFLIIPDRNKLISILNMGYSVFDQEQFVNLIKDAHQILLDNFDISITVSVSNEYNDIVYIRKAYKEAIDAHNYSSILQECDIIFSKDVQNNRLIYSYSLDMQHRLINYINNGNYKESSKMINDLFHKHLKKRNISVGALECLIFEILCTVIKSISSQNEEAIFKSYEPMNRLNSIKDLESKLQFVLEFVKEICIVKDKNKKSHNVVDLYESVNNYIERFYNDPNLNIAMIADYFNLTSSHLSKVYKKNSNTNIVDRINKVRIAKAKELIKEQHISINTVAEQVGFSYSNSFIRTYKKYEGITPGAYKDSLGK